MKEGNESKETYNQTIFILGMILAVFILGLFLILAMLGSTIFEFILQ